MQTVTATCISRKEIFRGIRLAEFEYSYHYAGEKEAPKGYSDSFTLVTAVDDLEVVWTIERSYEISHRIELDRTNGVIYFTPGLYCFWNKIVLLCSNRNIYGKILIHPTENDDEEKITFDMNTSKIEEEIYHSCEENREPLTISFEIFYECPSEDYGNFVKNKKGCAVVFVIRDVEFPTCKHVMAHRSEVFSKMFDYDTSSDRFSLDGVEILEPANFKLFMDFVYTGKVHSEDIDELLDLMVIANYFLLSALVNVAGLRVANSLSVDNAVEVLMTADQVNLIYLKKKCLNFIHKNRDKVAGTEMYRCLKKSKLKLHKCLAFELSEFHLC